MESYAIESKKKKSRLPARLDFLQSSTGLVLGLFVCVHIVLIASIILGPRSFNWVSQNMALTGFIWIPGTSGPMKNFTRSSVMMTGVAAA